MENKGLFFTFIILVFVLFLSLINVVFDLHGAFLRAELWLIVLFMIYAFILMVVFDRGRGVWCAMFIFFVLNIVNVAAIYARTLYLSSLILPIIVLLIGLYISAFKIERKEECEEPCVEEVKEEIEEKEKPGKKRRKGRKNNP